MHEAELLRRWQAGDKQAGDELLGSCFPILYRFFANKVTTEVDDLVQQTMMALSSACERFEHRSSFRSYLLSIARFQLYEHVRRHRRSSEYIEYDSVTAHDLSPSPSTLAVARAEQKILLEALRRIPLNFQIALELHYWEDLTGPELAEALDVPLDTAYSRVRKARELIKKQLRLLKSGMLPPTSTTEDDSWENELRGMPKA